MKTALFLFIAAVAVACAPVQQAPMPPGNGAGTAGVRFGVESVSPGVYRLTLDNGTTRPIGYNLCSSVLERRDGASWTPVSNDICTMQVNTLNPGFDATFEKRPEDLRAGEYRFVTRVESPLGTAPQVVMTSTFTVR